MFGVLWYVICQVNLLLLLLAVAFFTLFERKVMGSFHQRLGPSKIGLLGILQPLLDALKLFLKNKFSPNLSSVNYYSKIPMAALLLSSMIFILIPTSFKNLGSNNSFIIFLLMSSMSVFVILFSGWASNSKYTLMGSLRSIAQSISYEAVLSTLMLMIMSMYSTYSIESLSKFSSYLNLLFLFVWLICLLGETHRAPFDFSESESELVSGFNTEYSGADFAFLFLSEYIMILFGSILMVFLFFPLFFKASFWTICFLSMVFSYSMIWIRITFCRFRYDFLMAMAWKVLLPIVLILFLLSLILQI